MKLFKKAAAIVCGAATVAALSVTALTASAAGANEIVADQIYAEPGQKDVAFSVKLNGNTGFDQLNFSLKYDTRLTPVLEEGSTNIPKNESDEYSGLASVFVNPEKGVIGYGLVCSKKQDKDKALTTVYFDVPTDAKPGDEFAITFIDGNSKVLIGDDAQEFSNVAGWIKIKGVTTTTTTATTTSTTETTTTTTETTTSTTETTTSTVTTTDTTGSTGSTTGSTTTSGSTSGGTTTTAKATTKAAGTTASGGKQDGPTAGDAGVALAVAGLLAAAGTAIVIRKKD